MPTEVPIVQHQAILDAIAAGREAAAERAMKNHLREIFKSLPKLAQAFPDMFEPHVAAPSARPNVRRKVTR